MDRMRVFSRVVVGAGLFVLSVSIAYVHRDIGNGGLVVIAASFAGLLLMLDGIASTVSRALTVGDVLKHPPTMAKIWVSAVFFGFSLDILGALTTRLWYYPKFDFVPAIAASPVLYGLYGVILLLLYRLFVAVIGEVRWRSERTVSPALTRFEGFLGVFLLGAVVGHMMVFTADMGVGVLDISRAAGIAPAWWYPLIGLLPLFLIGEWWSDAQGKPTLTAALAGGNVTPVAAIVIASICGIVLTEVAHIHVSLWRYGTWPLNSMRVLGMPLLAVMVWPTQFLAYLALLRSVCTEEELIVWE